MNLQDELTLLRRFEPVLRFTRGESFFPMDVERYVRNSSLWVQRPNAEPALLVAQGALDLERLAYPYPDEFGTVHYLKFAEPLGAAAMAAHTLRQAQQGPPHASFHVGRGRLARVGYLSRLIDALFSISLLARGRVGPKPVAMRRLGETPFLMSTWRMVSARRFDSSMFFFAAPTSSVWP